MVPLAAPASSSAPPAAPCRRRGARAPAPPRSHDAAADDRDVGGQRVRRARLLDERRDHARLRIRLGCHWTPSANRSSGSSSASGSSSSSAQPVTAGRRRRGRCPGGGATGCRGAPRRPRARRATTRRGAPGGRCRRTCPAAAVVSWPSARAGPAQRAAARDVHQLHPAADAQQRDVALHRPRARARARTRRARCAALVGAGCGSAP